LIDGNCSTTELDEYIDAFVTATVPARVSPWLRAQRITCDDIPPDTVFLAEYANVDVPRPSAMA
jgi:predicted protein tyrosine phosphatase